MPIGYSYGSPRLISEYEFPTVGESKGVEVWERYQRNTLYMLLNSVQASSRETYMTGWKRWLAFSQFYGTDPCLLSCPPDWPTNFHVPYREVAVSSFIAKLVYEEKLSPTTVINYLSGIRHMLKGCMTNVEFFEAEVVKAARSAAMIYFRLTHPANETRTLPFVLDMILCACNILLDEAVPSDHIRGVALKVAYTFLFRRSEYIFQEVAPPNRAHFITSEDVVFRIGEDYVPAHSVTTNMEASLCEVIVTLRSAKNDSMCDGCRTSYTTTPGAALGTYEGFNIVVDMFSWAVRARLLPGDPFFAFRGVGCQPFRLSDTELTAIVKRTASHMQFSPTLFKLHSLRIGGASALAAAGVPDYLIQKLGRWKSLAFLQYIRLSRDSFNRAINLLTDTKGLCSEDVRVMNTAVELSAV